VKEKQLLKILEKIKEIKELLKEDSRGTWKISDCLDNLRSVVELELKALVWAKYQLEHKI